MIMICIAVQKKYAEITRRVAVNALLEVRKLPQARRWGMKRRAQPGKKQHVSFTTETRKINVSHQALLLPFRKQGT